MPSLHSQGPIHEIVYQNTVEQDRHNLPVSLYQTYPSSVAEEAQDSEVVGEV